MSVAEYEIETVGLDDLQDRLNRYPQIAHAVLKPAMSRAVIHLQGSVKRFTPVYQGTLIGRISQEVKPLFGDVGTMGRVYVSGVPYAQTMEVGRKPGTWPPIEPLRRWAHLVLGDESAGFLVARAIFKRGIKPRAMFARGLTRSKDYISRQFVKARDEIVKRLAGQR